MRTNVLLGDSVPASDILGIGVIGRYHLTNGWFAGAAIDAYKYDYENAALFAGIVQDPNESELDALASNTVVSGFIGRLYGKTDRGFDWFWSAGLGIGFPDIDNFSGLTLAGEEFALAFDAQTEIHVMGSFGTTYHFTPTWAATFAARLEHHFMDVTSTDAVSGVTSTLNSQSPFGAYISLDYRF
ncbi:MAG: hypothetical protein IIA07_09210 [Proteobacteria bacterium]|nr:hypothetical protein [Pseudomonadota bacterium]